MAPPGFFVLFYTNSFSIYLAKIIICHFRGKVNRFFLSEENPRKIHGKSTGRSLGKSDVTSTSTITYISIYKYIVRPRTILWTVLRMKCKLYVQIINRLSQILIGGFYGGKGQKGTEGNTFLPFTLIVKNRCRQKIKFPLFKMKRRFISIFACV